MVIIDADGHAVDYDAVYRERLPQEYRRRTTILPTDNFDRSQNGRIVKQPANAAQDLADNDREGIDLPGHLSDRRALPVPGRERDYAVALCRTRSAFMVPR
jgi:hypothetical protein